MIINSIVMAASACMFVADLGLHYEIYSVRHRFISHEARQLTNTCRQIAGAVS